MPERSRPQLTNTRDSLLLDGKMVDVPQLVVLNLQLVPPSRVSSCFGEQKDSTNPSRFFTAR
jgi:hypothetical protein